MRLVGWIGGTSRHATIAYYRRINEGVGKVIGRESNPELLIHGINIALRRLRPWLLVMAFLAWLPGAFAQSRVLDPEFDRLLDGLLSHRVPERGVGEIRDKKGLLFLDAREAREYEVSHIPEALWVGYDRFDLGRLQGVDKDQPIVVYCSVGYRSERVAEKLIGAGFTQVSNLYGGIFEWANQGRALNNEEGPTRAVHAYNRSWSKWLKKGVKVY